MWNKQLLELCKQSPEIFKQTPFFRDWIDSNIRRAGVNYNLSNDEYDESLKIKELNYFIDTLKDLSLRDYQYNTLMKFNDNRFNLVLTSRQVGIISVLAIYCLYRLVNEKDYKITICISKMYSGTEFIEKIKDLYKKLPFHLKPGVDVWNSKNISFDNGNRINIHTLNSNGVLGYNVSELMFFDIGTNPHFGNFYKTIIPVMFALKNSRVLIHSGFNTSKFISDLNKEENSYTKTILNYDVVPGRNSDWIEDQIKSLGGLAQFKHEYVYDEMPVLLEKKEYDFLYNMDKEDLIKYIIGMKNI